MAAVEASITDPSESVNGTDPHSLTEKKDEGLLRDVLDELDKERSQRAELQSKIRTLEKQVQAANEPKPTSVENSRVTTTKTSHEFQALEAERDGYLEIIEALTQDRPAFSKDQKLPLHVVRLLEVVPWDPRARQHLFGQEEVWEWQILGADKTWQARLRNFPTVFKTLPIVMPRPGRTVGEAPTSSSPPKQCVLTNMRVTHILNIDKGYPLPQDGGDWVWVGGWRIEKNSEADADGWSYSNDLDLTLERSYYSEFRPPQRGAPNLVKRRRKWTRARVLVDYLQASAMTKEYLKLVAEKASLDVSVEKLSSQLVETKMKLTTMEADHLALQEETSRKIAKLERELEDKNKVLDIIQQEDGIDAATISNLASKKDQVKELRSLVSTWVSSTVTKHTVPGVGTIGSSALEAQDRTDESLVDPTSATVDVTSHLGNGDVTQVFGSLRGKGTDFFEKIKQKGGEELEKIKKQNIGRQPWKTTLSKQILQTAEPQNETHEAPS